MGPVVCVYKGGYKVLCGYRSYLGFKGWRPLTGEECEGLGIGTRRISVVDLLDSNSGHFIKLLLYCYVLVHLAG